MTSKELVTRTMEFSYPSRLAMDTRVIRGAGRSYSESYFNDYPGDISLVIMTGNPYVVLSPTESMDDFGAIWSTTADGSHRGTVQRAAIYDIDKIEEYIFPDFSTKERVEMCKKMIAECPPDHYIMGFMGCLLFERMHFLLGYTEYMEHMALNYDKMHYLADRILEWDLKLIDAYAEAGVHGINGTDDWGLQSQLMISPAMFRDMYKPRYKKLIDRMHEHGMKLVLHSCGYITDILGDFIEVGLDCIQMDQQDNMGIENLAAKFGGKITFLNPVDIQTTLSTNNLELIEAKTKDMCEKLSGFGGGFLGRMYPQPDDIGIKEQSARMYLETAKKYWKP